MDKLILKKDNKIFFGDLEINRSSVDMAEFLIANLNTPVELEEGLTIEELVHFFYDCKGFIFSYFSEKYEILRALITVKNLKRNYKHVKIFKKIHIEDGYIYVHPSVDFILEESGKLKITELASVPVILSEDVDVFEDDFFNFLDDKKERSNKQYKSVITLHDIMRATFDDLCLYLRDEIINL